MFNILRQSCHDASHEHTYVQTMMYVRTCTAVPLPKMRNLETVRIFGRLLQKKPSTSSEEAFRFAEEAFRFAAKLRRKRKSGKTFRRAASFLKTCTVPVLLTGMFSVVIMVPM